jgi:hypothetical protein
VSEPNILRPSRTYNMHLKIKGENYTNDVSNVRITSSLAIGYQIVTITINITPQTILLNKLYGKDQIGLIINKLDESEIITESTVLDLMVLNSEFELPVSDLMTTDTQMDRSSFDLITVTRLPFETMTTMVNPVFGLTPSGGVFTGPKTIKQMIETIVNEFITTGPTLEYDSEGVNKDEILQCCIPPTTFYKAVQELDKNFGIYNGIPAIFCQYDNTLQIMNLSKRIKKNYTIFVEHLNNQSKEEDITKSMTDKKYFYTYDNLFTNYIGNSKFGVLGKTLVYTVLPDNELSHTFTHDLNTICVDYGVVGSTKEAPHINTSVAKRTKHYIDNNGFNKSQTFAISNMSKQIADVSRLSFSLERNLAIENLIKIGSVVKLQTKTQEHVDISGKYILFSSDISWTKQAEWQTTAKLELIRTNKTI